MNAFGIDVSRYQGLIDFEKAKIDLPYPITFVGICAGISWGYTDKWFIRNWSEFKSIKKFRSAYHALYPGENSIKQMDHFFSLLRNDIGELPLTIDAELHHNQSRRTITNKIIDCAGIIYRRTGNFPLLYTRTEWLNTYTYPDELSFLQLWLAQYLNVEKNQVYAKEHPGPPTLPKGFTNWTFHQTGSKTPPSYGVQSKSLDYDRFNGTLEMFLDKFDLTNEQLDLTLDDRVLRLELQAREKG